MKTQNHRPETIKVWWLDFLRNMWGDKTMGKKTQKLRYDQEWIQLIKEAKKIGLTQEEVRQLFNKKEILNMLHGDFLDNLLQ